MPDRPALLILGGTGEALALAAAATARFGARLRVVSSLAGRTRAPRTPAGETRVGGFGGADGLAAFLRRERIGLLVDATHPFAARISANAAEACLRANVPRLTLERPPWTPRTDDDWRTVPDLVAAAGVLPELARCAFLTVGSGELDAFAGVVGVRFVVRTVDPPERPLGLPGDAVTVVGRGPFTVSGERAIVRRYGVEAIVAKNSGGDATAAKLAAARAERIPVLMVDRPAPVEGLRVATVEEVIAWLAGQVEAGGVV